MGRDDTTKHMQEAKHDSPHTAQDAGENADEHAKGYVETAIDKLLGAANAAAEAVGLKQYDDGDDEEQVEADQAVNELETTVDSAAEAMQERDANGVPEEQDERGVLSSAAHGIVHGTAAAVKGTVVAVAERVGLVEDHRDAALHDLLAHVKEVVGEARDSVADKAEHAKEVVVEKAGQAKEAIASQAPLPDAEPQALSEQIEQALRPASVVDEQDTTLVNATTAQSPKTDELPSLTNAPQLPSEHDVGPRAPTPPTRGVSYAEAASAAQERS